MSNVDTQSNPSDFDFADMQQDSEDIEEVTVMVSCKNMLNNNKFQSIAISFSHNIAIMIATGYSTH